MIKRLTYYFVIIGLCFTTIIHAQLSPGKLTTAHQDLEGIANCTQCHDLGNKVPDSKCLECHDEIQNLINLDRGYHASTEVKEKECIDCHSEHHGRKFEMTRFDQDDFDHQLTGYILEGQHNVIDCRDCHQPDNILNSDLKKRTSTFLGLSEDCKTCHEDYHQSTLDNNCISCHDFEAFRPALGFDHNEAAFNLKGAHVDVECIDCHPIQIRSGKEFQQFNELSFSNCIDCHDNPHQQLLQNQCTQCHTESSFNQFIGNKHFNHNITQFELKGKHNNVNCIDCHSKNLVIDYIFQDLTGTDENQCIACHDDVHNGKFGTNCSSCHNETGFSNLNNMDSFDHSMTDYPLEGQHIGVDCKSCHLGKYTEPINFDNCYNCHDDYHNGEFTTNNIQRDCKECHSLNNDFTYTLFGFVEHEETSFPLEGAHMATPCFACHVSEDHWSFRNIGQACIDCHDDIHDGVMSEKYYPNKSCTNCHNSESWSSITFDHNLTDWALEGQHNETSCNSCHFDESKDNLLFINTSQDCQSCHDNPHGEQFNLNGITDCKRCHTSLDWYPDI
ncbi:MAG: cytochrome c family protein, partial [Saprospiraceae bacterium]|nr:cytochrome c family protein [Saprospiraceae bacterium]